MNLPQSSAPFHKSPPLILSRLKWSQYLGWTFWKAYCNQNVQKLDFTEGLYVILSVIWATREALTAHNLVELCDGLVWTCMPHLDLLRPGQGIPGRAHGFCFGLNLRGRCGSAPYMASPWFGCCAVSCSCVSVAPVWVCSGQWVSFHLWWWWFGAAMELVCWSVPWLGLIKPFCLHICGSLWDSNYVRYWGECNPYLNMIYITHLAILKCVCGREARSMHSYATLSTVCRSLVSKDVGIMPRSSLDWV